MDINWAIRSAMSTGRVYLGVKQTKQYARRGKMIIRARTAPFSEFRSGSYEGVPVYTYPGSGMELGSACGRPFGVSVLVVVDPGESGILSLLRETS